MRRYLLVLVLAGGLIGCGSDQPATAKAPSYQRATIDRVVDGDTLATSRGRVRLLGVDTPEIYFHRECGGPEASKFTKSLLAPGAHVRLYRDDTQGDKDRFGRLLRYVHITRPGTNDVSMALVQAGWAEVYEKYPVARTPRYRRAQKVAQDHHRGIWGLCS